MSARNIYDRTVTKLKLRFILIPKYIYIPALKTKFNRKKAYYSWKLNMVKECFLRNFFHLSGKVFTFVNVYQVDRCYGGPEEGGWWYNSYHQIDSKMTINTLADMIKEEMAEKYKGMAYGNIYSMRGGLEIGVYKEIRPKQSELRNRPYYH